jgi:hypothetical protein
VTGTELASALLTPAQFPAGFEDDPAAALNSGNSQASTGENYAEAVYQFANSGAADVFCAGWAEATREGPNRDPGSPGSAERLSRLD